MNAISPASQFKNKGEVFEALNSGLPLNDFQLPDHIYRADLVPENIFELPQKDKGNVLDAASLQITFSHGYPAIMETQPMWEQLPSESPEAYNAFMTFLELPEKSNHANPIRLLPHISMLISTTLEKVTQWCHIYYWHWRARAYDLFLIAAHRKQREQRIMTIEGAHFVMAERSLNKITKMLDIKLDHGIDALENPNSEHEADFSTKDLVGIMKELIGIQRISVGLPANGVSQVDLKTQGPRHATADETFKSVAKEGASETSTSQRPVEMDRLLEDPDELARAQELLIKMTSTHQPRMFDRDKARQNQRKLAHAHQHIPLDGDDSDTLGIIDIDPKTGEPITPSRDEM